MEFSIDRNTFLKSLGHTIGIIEKKTTLPILSNILIEAKDSKIKITATDLDIIYYEKILPKEIKKEGSTTTSASVLYDILRKLKPDDNVELNLQNNSRLKLVSGNSKFNLLCLSSDNFPLSEEDIDQEKFEVSSQKLLKFLNKTKISISNDETRHYLNGIYLHKTKLENKTLAIIDPRNDYKRDKTWSFWKVINHNFDDCIKKSWNNFSIKTFNVSPSLISAFCPGLENSDKGILPSLLSPTSTIAMSFSIAITFPLTIDFSLLSFCCSDFDINSS